ncbi:MAG: hypothetical protein AABY06_00465 [Nanoarchaeota archaeon]
MENLFNKISKNVFLPLAVAGGLVLGGCGNKDLEEFNQENKQIYSDFKKFCNENPNKKEYAESQYKIEFPNNKYHINFAPTYLHISTNGEDFFDYKMDGLDNGPFDSQTFTNKNTGLIENEYIKNLSPEKQLLVAEEYNSLLKEIMHDAKYKNY